MEGDIDTNPPIKKVLEAYRNNPLPDEHFEDLKQDVTNWIKRNFQMEIQRHIECEGDCDFCLGNTSTKEYLEDFYYTLTGEDIPQGPMKGTSTTQED